MKRPLPPADPFHIFTHAVHLLEMDEFLRSNLLPTSPAQRYVSQMSIATSTTLLGAFEIELFLKCLLLIEKSDVPATHRLDVLFRRLSHKRKRRIVDRWDNDARGQIETFARENKLPTDLPNAIVACANAFDRLRYPYEDPNANRFYLGRLPRILMEVIAEDKPDWIDWRA